MYLFDDEPTNDELIPDPPHVCVGVPAGTLCDLCAPWVAAANDLGPAPF